MRLISPAVSRLTYEQWFEHVGKCDGSHASTVVWERFAIKSSQPHCPACAARRRHTGIRYGHSIACIISFNCPYTCVHRIVVYVYFCAPSIFPHSIRLHSRSTLLDDVYTRRCGSVGVSFTSFYISSQSYKSIASKRNAMMMMMMYGYVKDCTLHNTIQYKPYQNTHQCAHRILTTSGISMRIHIVIHSAIKRWTIF